MDHERRRDVVREREGKIDCLSLPPEAERHRAIVMEDGGRLDVQEPSRERCLRVWPIFPGQAVPEMNSNEHQTCRPAGPVSLVRSDREEETKSEAVATDDDAVRTLAADRSK